MKCFFLNIFLLVLLGPTGDQALSQSGSPLVLLPRKPSGILGVPRLPRDLREPGLPGMPSKQRPGRPIWPTENRGALAPASLSGMLGVHELPKMPRKQIPGRSRSVRQQTTEKRQHQRVFPGEKGDVAVKRNTGPKSLVSRNVYSEPEEKEETGVSALSGSDGVPRQQENITGTPDQLMITEKTEKTASGLNSI